MSNIARHPFSLFLFLLLLMIPSTAPNASARAPATQRYSQIAEGYESAGGVVEHFDLPVSGTAGPAVAHSGGAGAPGTTGEQRTLVSLVNFTNDPSTPWLLADVDSQILDDSDPDSTASYVLEASYGRAWLTGSANDWVSASYPDTTCNLALPAGTQQLIDELDTFIDFSSIDRWIILMPFSSACPFLGISTLGDWTFDSDEGSVSFSRVVVNGTTTILANLVSHELGHSLIGLQHAEDHECGVDVVGPNCSDGGSDHYSVMGSSTWGGHFTPPSKEALGWFATDLVDVAAPGGTYLIEPYETTGGTKTLRIAAPWYVSDYREGRHYYVSFRQRTGFDSDFPTLDVDGAMLHLDAHYFPEFTTEAIGASRLLDATPLNTSNVLLEVGQSFFDATHGITIETLGVVSGSLEVRVTIDQYCGDDDVDAAFAESCDGTDLDGETCASLGFTSGTLACAPSCTFDTASCGAAVCEPSDTYDLVNDLCTASLLSVAPDDMSLYRNSPTWSGARYSPTTTLLTKTRGFFGVFQNHAGNPNTILYRMVLPFDTSVLPDGALIDSATLHLKLDAYPDPITNNQPNSADQLVLVQTNDPQPTVRESTDFGTFVPIENPDEGAPRVEVDTLVAPQPFSMALNANGISWIDDTGYAKLGLRWGFDVDDVSFPSGELEMRLGIVPPISPISGPRLEIDYTPVPEPGGAAGLFAGWAVLAGLSRRRGARQARNPAMRRLSAT